MTPELEPQSGVDEDVKLEMAPLNVPGVLRLLFAAAMYAGVVELVVDMLHETLVSNPGVNQLGSDVGSAAVLTVMVNEMVAVS